MLGPRSERGISFFDPFTLSDYENLIRIIRVYAMENPGIIELKGDSFSLGDDITIEDLISLSGIFTCPYEIRESRAQLTVKKNSFYLRNPDEQDVTSRIFTEARCEFLLRKDWEAETTTHPTMLKCELTSTTQYVEKAESTLLSKKKTFVEKTFTHLLSAAEMRVETEPLPLHETVIKTYRKEGYCKIDVSTGYVVEEKG